MLENILQEILKSPHFNNINKKHEKFVLSILKENGYEEIKIQYDKKQFVNYIREDGSVFSLINRNNIKKSISECVIKNKGLYVIHEPMGTQLTPDILVIENGVVFYIDCKSSANEKITWNTSLPSKNSIYICSSEKYNCQTIFNGDDVINDDIKDIYNKYICKMKEIEKELNLKLCECGNNKYGWTYYIRNMYTQTGKKEMSSFFSNKNRKQNEINVINRVIKRIKK